MFRLRTPGFWLRQLLAVWLWGKSPALSEPAAVMCRRICYEVWKNVVLESGLTFVRLRTGLPATQRDHL